MSDATDIPESPSEPPFDARAFLAQLTSGPGVYRMYDAAGELLYVGKARNLKKRVSSYFLRASGNPRIESMVEQIRRMEVTLTRTEDEALLLEATLIKELDPRYNIMYRDDKSYPLLRIGLDHDYPRISFHRGARTGKARYFGPFPSAQSVRESLLTLQKLFRLRPCKDSFFDSRQRPCLQHQIGRCSAPCVGLVSVSDYAGDVAAAVRLLEGRGEELTADLAQSMERAAEALEFERAARLRDQIVALRRVRESRAITGGAEQLDVVAVAPHAARSALVVVQVRDGLNLGHASHFPRHPVDTAPEEVVAAFLEQHYVDWPPPGEILLSHWPAEAEWIAESLSRRAGRRVRLLRPQRGVKHQLMQMAQETAAQALSARIAQSSSADQRLRALQQGLKLAAPPARIECFDISHTMGERPVASCVVFEDGQPHKVAYRKFNIEDVTPGDDYAAIAQAVRRRLARVAAGEGRPPDLLLIDGGRGQLTAAQASLAAILAEADAHGRAVLEAIRLVAVAKGPTRRPGLEQLWLPERKSAVVLPPDSPGLHLIQQIRDEAHRFAITGHRGRRDKARRVSTLEQIEGLGPARRRALLNTLGGLPQLKRAGIDDIAAVPGISRRLAERIHAFFH